MYTVNLVVQLNLTFLLKYIKIAECLHFVGYAALDSALGSAVICGIQNMH